MNNLNESTIIKKLFDVPNYRNINAYFLPPTNYRAARICIEETHTYNDYKTTREYFPYCYGTGGTDKQAFNILQAAGFNVMARSYNVNKYIFLVDNWGEDYIKISDL